MVTTIGLFLDFPMASTGMAVVGHNTARQFSKKSKVRVIYFGRFGYNREGISPQSEHQLYKGYEYVPTEGGVWKEKTVRKAIDMYNLDIVFSEDDWFSAQGLVDAVTKSDVPFHFLTPIDSLPIHKDAFKIFEKCTKVYVPNSSYKLISNGVYLPHGVNTIMFRPLTKKQKRIFPKFTFLWIGRNEERKAMGRAILALKKINSKVDVQMVIRSDWKTEWGHKTATYLVRHKELKIVRDQMKNIEHGYMQQIYANCDVLIITSEAGGFELQSIEAMACGLPVLCTDFTFMNEQIVDGKNGFLIPVSDIKPAYGNPNDSRSQGRLWGKISIDKLAEKMLWCARNPEKVKVMGNWAKKHVTDNYSWAKMVDKLYKEMGL